MNFNDSHVREILRSVVAEIKRGFLLSSLMSNDESLSDLISVTIIGRDPVIRRIDQVMDLDIVVVLSDPMTKVKLAEVTRIFQNIQNLSSSSTGISFQIADGPIKPHVEKQVNIFLHVLLHTVSSYKASPLILVKNSWQYEGHTLIGSELKSIQSISQPSLEEFINGTLGIQHCLELVVSSSSAYLEWTTNNSEQLDITLKPIKFSDSHEILEICYYSVLRGASNSLRYLLSDSQNIGIDLQDMDMFSKVFSMHSFRNFPIEIYADKTRLRNGSFHPKHSDLVVTIDKSISFLQLLINVLPSMSKLSR